MVALAYDPQYSPTVPQGYGQDAQTMHDTMKNALKHLSSSVEAYSIPTDCYKAAVIRRVIKESTGYASLPYIVKKSRVAVDDAERILVSSAEFRKSFIRTESGDMVFMINFRFAGIVDAWNSFRYLNAIKS